jgi:hypothetical protein
VNRCSYTIKKKGGPGKPGAKGLGGVRPHQGGYVGFSPISYESKEDLLQACSKAPTRTTAFDDLHFYITQQLESSKAESQPGHDILAVILRKFVVSHHMTVIEYVKNVVSDLEFQLEQSAGDLNNIESMQWIESGCGDILAWGRRLSEYCEDIENSLDDFDADQTPSKRDWNCNDDFRYVHRKMLRLKTRTNNIIGSITGVIGILQARRSVLEAKQSLKEAKAVTTLTFLGTLFLPLSFAAGLFSMGPNYVPGGADFHVYLSLAVPLTIVIFGGIFMYTLMGTRIWNNVPEGHLEEANEGHIRRGEERQDV